MRFEPISSSLYRARRAEFFRHMEKNSIAYFFSSDVLPRTADQHFPFRQDSALLALTGLHQAETALVLHRGSTAKSLHTYLFISPADPRHTTWNGKRLSRNDASRYSGIENVFTTKQMDTIIRPLIDASGSIYVNTSLRDQADPIWPSQNKRQADLIKNKWPDKTIHSAQMILEKIFMVKHPLEIETMKKAIEVTGDAFQRVLKMVRPGLKEYEVEASLTHTIIKRGCHHAFDPIVASGKSACTLHYIQNDGLLRKESLLLLDFGAEYAGMASDMSRTIPVSGKFSSRHRAIYTSVLHVLLEVTDMMRPGMTLTQLNIETGKLIDQALVQLKLVTRHELRRQDPDHPLRKKYFMHGVSHHLGWDVHDIHDRSATFKSGMVLTCEPGLYIPAEKTGIRLENDILITRGTPKNLMAHIPIDPDEIETLMNDKT